MNESLLRELPSVEELAALLAPEYPAVPRRVINDEVRAAIAAIRTRLREGAADAPAPEVLARHSLRRLLAPSLQRVINATGVILHTNLGRAPLGARQAIPGYSNLEYDLTTGRRGKRDAHIAPLLLRLLGKPGIVVNNNAAAVWLALNELAAGQEVIVSRG
ncbi:MAG: L-seryl-tRNA(Sec) selenium transferase, partial [Bryobacteraceae bacterium]